MAEIRSHQMDWPTVMIEIPGKGRVNVAIVGVNAVYAQVKPGDFVMRGVSVYGNCHFSIEAGEVVSMHDAQGSRWFTARRVDRAMTEAPAGVTMALHEFMRRAVGIAYEDHPLAFAQGASVSISNAIVRENEEITKLEKSLRERLTARAALIDQENTAIDRIAMLTPENNDAEASELSPGC